MTNTPKGSSLNNTNSCRLKFARRFLLSLTEIKSRQINNHNSNLSSSSLDEIRKRSQRIKLAAYSSMAYAVGRRKAWTRALLLKLQKREKRRRRLIRMRSFGPVLVKKKRVVKAERESINVINDKIENLGELIPGGKAMDICSLFEETAHFIKCLTMQVQVMQDIADQLSK